MAEEGQESRTPHTIPELSTSVDRRFEAVERRFDAVDHRFEAVDRRFDAVDRRFDEVDRRFDEVDRRFDAVDQRFETVDRRFDEFGAALIEQRQYTEFAFGKLEQELLDVKSGFGRMERKLDRLIDAAFPSEKPRPE